MKISVFSLFRDSGDLINETLSRLDGMRDKTDADFEYFFYENDSRDETPLILKEWMSNKSGKVLTENLNIQKFNSTFEPQRMIHLSNIRNKMLSLAGKINSDYSVIFDSDVIFDEDIINRYLEYKDLKFSMLTPNIRQNIPCKMSGVSDSSYYDSSILFDLEGTNCMTWSDNPFFEESDRDKFNNLEPIRVARAFGGFTFLKSDALSNCKWMSKGESEHWSFCDQLIKFGDIYLIPDIKVFVDIVLPALPSGHMDSVISKQKKLLESPWNRFLWKRGAFQV